MKERSFGLLEGGKSMVSEGKIDVSKSGITARAIKF